jgi:hypothetical protein
MRGAMEAAGLDPDEVAAKAAELDLDASEPVPAPSSQRSATPVDDGQETLLGVMAPTGEELRDEGMERALRAAPADWKAVAWQAILDLTDAGSEFTSDAVWEKVGFSPPEPRALGPLLLRAQRAGMIRPSGERRSSERAVRHAGPVSVWERVG